MLKTRLCLYVVLAVFGLMFAAQPVLAADTVQVARDGKAQMGIVIANSASDETKAHAATLADYLQKITGGDFQVMAGVASEKAILVGTADDFPSLAQGVFDTSDDASQEQYLLRSRDGQLQVIGISDLAVRHAVWDLLYRAGHRQFFPTDTWEVIPHAPSLSFEVDTLQKPAYSYRRIWPTYNTWPENKPLWATWNQRNRMGGDFRLNSGHAYGNIIAKNKAAFEEHPEYYALVDGKRRINPQAKFCISNPGLRKLVVDFIDKNLQANPDADSVSVDPSDGGHWCECDQCARIGTPSDLALTLANDVSELLEKKYPKTYVAMYAYNYHGPPPTKVRARPRVIVTVATAFIKGGLTFEGIMEGWREMGVRQFGVREYYSIIHWDKDLPRGPKASNLQALADSIRRFHDMGAKFMSAESSENFGPAGVGYYIASRALWDPQEASHVQALYDDFITRAFGQAAPAMRDFYEVLHGKDQPRFSEHVVAKLYLALDKAAALARTPEVKARINALTLYARHLELYRQYLNTSSRDGRRVEALGKVIQHSYRMRGEMLVHSLAHYRTGFRDRGARIPKEYSWKIPEDKNPWKNSEPFTEQDYQTMRQQGVAGNHLRGFEEVTFGPNLEPVRRDAKGPEVSALGRARGRQVYITWLDRVRPIPLRVTSGLIYKNRGPCHVILEQWDEDAAEFKEIQHEQIPQDEQPHNVILKPVEAGLHRVIFSDRNSATSSTWPAGLPVMIEASSDYTMFNVGRRSMYFFVPTGTKSVGVFVPSKNGSLHYPDGSLALDFEKQSGYLHVDVPPGQDGKLWSYRHVAGRIQLLTVPPYVTPDAAMLLLPREVIQAERQ